MSTSQKKPTIAEPEISNGGIMHSNAKAPGGSSASSEELAKALGDSQATIKMLQEQLNSKSSDNSIDRLALMLAEALKPKKEMQPVTDQDDLNRVSDFKNTKINVDGRSLMEAQQALQSFRTEPHKSIVVSKSIGNFVGTTLDITVNGVRVSIPCDGKPHRINETHWEHAKERIAKLEFLNSQTEPQISEIG